MTDIFLRVHKTFHKTHEQYPQVSADVHELYLENVNNVHVLFIPQTTVLTPDDLVHTPDPHRYSTWEQLRGRYACIEIIKLTGEINDHHVIWSGSQERRPTISIGARLVAWWLGSSDANSWYNQVRSTYNFVRDDKNLLNQLYFYSQLFKQGNANERLIFYYDKVR